jgi:hypothetical protein
MAAGKHVALCACGPCESAVWCVGRSGALQSRIAPDMQNASLDHCRSSLDVQKWRLFRRWGITAPTAGIDRYADALDPILPLTTLPGSDLHRCRLAWPAATVDASRRKGTPMTQLRIRLTASDDDTMQLINRISSVEGIESVEEIDDLMPHMDDEDSSSAGLSDDIGPGTHLLLVHGESDSDAKLALDVAFASAREMGIVVELVEDD